MKSPNVWREVKNPLQDAVARRRFSQELGCNFSVIAPAGVGKTTAIVDRVVNIVQIDDKRQGTGLRPLAIVTYTRKAARDMEIRSRNALLQQGARPESLVRLSQAFFGTIHSFCLELIRAEGHFLGLSPAIEIANNHTSLWLQFIRENDRVVDIMEGSKLDGFRRHCEVGKVIELAREWRGSGPTNKTLEPLPKPDLAPLLNFVPNGRTKKGVEEGKAILHRWEKLFEENQSYLPLPHFNKGGREFQALWNRAFLPLRTWLESFGMEAVKQVARDYRDYRVNRGLLTYDDLVYLATTLLAHPVAGPRLRSRAYSVILDEAQDTDRDQFRVLLGLTRSGNTKGDWLNGEGPPPEPGRFCMVGDPQQSIYGSRADLPTYLDIHRRFVEHGVGEGLNFSVTFRCDRQIVDAVNRCFSAILNDCYGQVGFERLTARPDAGPGQVIRCRLRPTKALKPDRDVETSSMDEARSLAAWLQSIGTEGLGIKEWAEVAVLCPRRRWLSTLSSAFEEVGLKVVLQSSEEIWGDSPAVAWLTALVVIMAEPDNSFEIVGVLREIFGVSDHDLARYVEERHSYVDSGFHPVRICDPIMGEGQVVEVLNSLVKIRSDVDSLPLYEVLASLVDKTKLRQRLSVLPGYPKELLMATLDALLEEVADWEEQGHSLTEVAALLRTRFQEEVQDVEGSSDQISLITCHKAKGLEWNVVILPFLFRKINFFSDPYPRIVRAPEKRSSRMILSREEDLGALQKQLDRDRMQECERLLYVAATRARQSLVLVDSSSFYENGPIGRGFSFGELLQILPGEVNHPIWNSLPWDPKIQNADLELPADAPGAKELVDRFDPSVFNEAAVVASCFVRRVTPSSLAVAGGASLHREESDLATLPSFPEMFVIEQRQDGIDYGNWWHQMMESNHWKEGIGEWTRHFNKSLALCPDPNRGRIEVELFSNAPLVQILLSPELKITTEVPILWKSNKGIAYEGFIDLVAWNETSRNWLVVDWKTDQTKVHAGSKLMNTYANQLKAYAESLMGLAPETTADVLLYSTVLGETQTFVQ